MFTKVSLQKYFLLVLRFRLLHPVAVAVAHVMGDSTTEVKKYTYFVPEEFFQLKGAGPAKGSYTFICKKCIKQTINANYKSRFNLREHVKKKHSRSLKAFDEACNVQDGRKKVGLTTYLEVL